MSPKLILLVTILSLTALVNAYGGEPVINFVTDAGGSTVAADNSAAFASAVNLSSYTGYPVYIPPGVYRFTKAISSSDVIVRGASQARTTLIWTSVLPSGTAAYDVYGSNSIISHLSLTTSFRRQNGVGVAPCFFDGIRLNSNSNLLYVSMQNFRAGLVWNSNGGHSISEHIHSTNNYYGLYVQRSNGDNYIGLSGLEGNTMASIGIPANGQMGAGDMIFRTHMCYGPYGVYQEGPSTTGVYSNFLGDAHFQLARFEGCGNGAIFSENVGTSAYGGIRDTEFYNVGFSWGSNYRIANKSANYAVNVGTVQNDCYYFPGASPFGKGAKGIFNLNQAWNWNKFHTYATDVCCTV